VRAGLAPGSEIYFDRRGMSYRRISVFIPPFLLICMVAAIATGVQLYASPPGGLQLPLATEGEGDMRIRTGSASYPRQAIDSDGITVNVARPTHRIVSQYWSIDEYLYSVVPPQDVVAVSESAYLKSVSNVYEQVQRFHPVVATDPERVLALNPDLMLVSSSGPADYTSLVRSTGVPVYSMQVSFQTLAQVEQTIRLTGYLTGNDEAAEKEAARFQAEIAQAKALRPPNAPKPRILGLGDRFSYGKETLFGDIVTTLGGINVAAENGLRGYDSINFEQIIRWNPEWIIAEADPGKEKEVIANLLADPAIALTQAARNGHIVVFDNHVFLPMSPYTTLLVRAMAEAIYGNSRSASAESHE
jgi:iron complex transport system substrate-binding protein